MSSNISTIIACPQIQEDLNNQFVQFDPIGAKEPQGFTDFVVSPTNTNGVLQNMIAGGRGKLKQVQLIWTPPYLESDVSTDAVKKCVSTNEKGQIDHTYEIDPTEGVQIDEKFDLLHMANMCKDNSLWFAQRIQAMLDALTKKIGTINANQLALLTGAFATGDSAIASNVKTIRTRKATSGDFDIDALAEITFSATNTSYGSKPFVFGFGEIYKYMKKLAAGAVAAEGVDYGAFAAMNDLVYVADKKVKAALGGENFVMLAAGAVQMLSFLEFEGEKGINMIDDDSYKQTVITDPKTGIRYDLQLKNDCGVISVSIKKAHKLVGLPTDLYSLGSPYHNVTWVNEFAIDNA